MMKEDVVFLAFEQVEIVDLGCPQASRVVRQRQDFPPRSESLVGCSPPPNATRKCSRIRAPKLHVVQRILKDDFEQGSKIQRRSRKNVLSLNFRKPTGTAFL